MTICIAAIAREVTVPGPPQRGVEYVVLAADRMLTTGDTEYEPRSVAGLTLKMSGLTNTCALMIAGDVADATAITQASQLAVASKGVTAVQGVANVVTDSFADLRARRAASRYLAPLGLTPQNFISNSQSLHDALIEGLTEQVQNARLSVGAIVAGLDAGGAPHIYTIADPGIARSQDLTGFGAIGRGANHATLEFTKRGYAPDHDIYDSVSLVYSAKRAAETAVGVGRDTDMAIIAPDGIVKFDDGMMKIVEDAYDKVVAGQDDAWQEERSDILNGFADLTRKMRQQNDDTTATNQPEAPGPSTEG